MKRVLLLVSIFILTVTACSKDNKSKEIHDIISSEDFDFKPQRDSLALLYKNLIKDIDEYLYIWIDSFQTHDKKNLKALTAYNETGDILLALIEDDKEVKNKAMLTGHKSSLDAKTITRFIPFVVQENFGFAVSVFHINSYEANEIYMGIPKNDSFTYIILDNSEGQNNYASISNIGDEVFVISTPSFDQAKTFDSYTGEYLYDYESFDMEYNYIYSLRKNKTVIRYYKDTGRISETGDQGLKVSLISMDKHLRSDLPYEKYEHIVYWEHIIKIDDDWKPLGDEIKDINIVFEESLKTFKYGYEISGWKYDENRVLAPVSLSSIYTFDKDTGEILEE